MIRRLFGPGEVRDVLMVLLVAIALWEAAVYVFEPSRLILPAPSAILAAFWQAPGLFLRHLGFTLAMTATGFGLAVVLGILLAVLIVSSTLVERTVYTLLVALIRKAVHKGASDALRAFKEKANG